MMREFKTLDDMPLAIYRDNVAALFGEFSRTYNEWSGGQKDDNFSYAMKEVLWQRYVNARDAYLSRPRRDYD